MDNATVSALRAIILGLRKSGAISDPHVSAIVAELEATDESLSNHTGVRIPLRRLCMDIARDNGVETSIEAAEPELKWGH